MGLASVTGDSIRDRLQRLFDGLLDASAAPGGAGAWSPLADIVETPLGYSVHLDVPGIEPDAVEVRVDGRRLTVRGHRAYPQRAPQQVARLECHYGDFARVVELPSEVDPAVARRYENGVLILELTHG